MLLTFLTVLVGGLGFLGIYTLHTSPALSFETGFVFSLSAPTIQRIDHVTLASPFFLRLPEFFTPAAETAWWQRQESVYALLTSQRTVQVEVMGQGGRSTIEQALVADMPLSEVLHRTWLIYLVAFLYVVCAFSVFRRHRSPPGMLLAFFFLALPCTS
jgi:hypothetical protein